MALAFLHQLQTRGIASVTRGRDLETGDLGYAHGGPMTHQAGHDDEIHDQDAEQCDAAESNEETEHTAHRALH
jgi:hypothetical protein